MYWQKEYETMDREALRELQGKRLRATVERVYNNVAPYRKKMDDIGLTPADINSIDDLKKLTFTTKQDLRDAYPFGMFAVPSTMSAEFTPRRARRASRPSLATQGRTSKSGAM